MIERYPVFSTIARWMLPVGILAGGLGGFFILLKLKQDPAGATNPVVERTVATVAVQPQQDLQLDVDGRVVPAREIILAAEVGGQIVRKADEFRAGGFVAAGTELIQIDSADYQLQVERLEAELQQTAVQLDELAAEIAGTERLLQLAAEDVALGRQELERQQGLATSGTVTASALDQARQTELAARNSQQTLRNELRLLERRRNRLRQARELVAANLEQAQANLKRTTIRAPADSIVVRENVEKHDYVTPGAEVAALEDTSAVEVDCDLRLDQVAWLWRQQASGTISASSADLTQASSAYEVPRTPVTVVYRLENHEFAWDGVLSRFGGQGVDPLTRTVPCRVTVAEPRRPRPLGDAPIEFAPPALLRGMFVTVRIHVAPPPGSLLRVPETAIRPGNRVWTVRDGQLQIESVKLVNLVQADPGPSELTLTSQGDSVGPNALPASPAARTNDTGDAPIAVREATGQSPVLTDGIVVPLSEVRLAAEIAGRIANKTAVCRAGNYVEAGTLLFEFDKTNYELEARRLTKELDQAEAMLDELQEELSGNQQLSALAQEDTTLRRSELQRQERLVGRGATQADVEAAQRALLLARQNEIKLQNEQQLLQLRARRQQFARKAIAAQLAQARLALRETVVRAPISGILVSDAVEQDSYVRPGDELVILEDTSVVEVQCKLSSEMLYRLWRSAAGPISSMSDHYEFPSVRVEVFYELDGRRYRWRGLLWRMEGTGVDPTTRRIPCRVRIDEPRAGVLVEASGTGSGTRVGEPPALVRGMYVTVRVASPAAASAPPTPVSRGSQAGEYHAILDAAASGLQIGDRVVVTPLAGAAEGLAVQEHLDE